jgi:FKBP-type peptidyl-prolyl cis-trans isomerase
MKNKVLTSIATVAVIGLVVYGVIWFKGSSTKTASTDVQSKQTQDGGKKVESQVTELGVVDTVVGTGIEAVASKKVTVHYTGTLTDGTKFDSSVDRGTPFSFTLGAGEVIKGWDQGFAGMKVGGKRKLTIPASMGYGSRANGKIPADSTLLFDVELLGVE